MLSHPRGCFGCLQGHLNLPVPIPKKPFLHRRPHSVRNPSANGFPSPSAILEMRFAGKEEIPKYPDNQGAFQQSDKGLACLTVLTLNLLATPGRFDSCRPHHKEKILPATAGRFSYLKNED